MTAFLQDHPYLIANITISGLLALFLALRPTCIGQSLLSGLLFVPFCLTGLEFSPVYWSPQRLGNLSLGLEDVLFCFNMGVMSWVIATSLFTMKKRGSARGKTKWIGGFFGLLVLGGMFFLIARTAGMPLMLAHVISGCIMILILATQVKNGYLQALVLGVTGTVIHYLITAMTISVWPSYYNYFNHEALLGLDMGGVPIEELLWAFAFFAGWPLFVSILYQIDSVELTTNITLRKPGNADQGRYAQ